MNMSLPNKVYAPLKVLKHGERFLKEKDSSTILFYTKCKIHFNPERAYLYKQCPSRNKDIKNSSYLPLRSTITYFFNFFRNAGKKSINLYTFMHCI